MKTGPHLQCVCCGSRVIYDSAIAVLVAIGTAPYQQATLADVAYLADVAIETARKTTLRYRELFQVRQTKDKQAAIWSLSPKGLEMFTAIQKRAGERAAE